MPNDCPHTSVLNHVMRSPNRLLPAGPLSVVASQQHSAQIGAAVDMAVTTAQTKIKLNDGSTSNPTVSCVRVIKWAKKHLEKSNISGYGAVTTILQLLIDDMSMDLTPHITAEPAVSDDQVLRKRGVCFTHSRSNSEVWWW